MKYAIITYGCAANQSDSAIMDALLSVKHEKTNEEEADVIIVNGCAVKKPTADKILNKIKKLIENKKKVVVAGCLPIIEKKKVEKLNPFGILYPNSIDEIKTILTNGGKATKNKKINKALLKKRCKDNYIVQIGEGCLGACTYCGTRLARGHLKSFPVEDILSDIKRAVDLGFKTIYLTSQDNGCYGYDIGTDIVHLLDEICKRFKISIRVGMMNPEHVISFLPELISVYKNKQIIKFLHIPIQSASNKILKDMNRGYKVEDVKEIINSSRKEIPDIVISTDIIVGYPTETEQDFQKTLDFIKEMKPDVLNISKFFSRPNTPAEKLEPLPPQTIKKRAKEVMDVWLSMRKQRNKNRKNKIVV